MNKKGAEMNRNVVEKRMNGQESGRMNWVEKSVSGDYK